MTSKFLVLAITLITDINYLQSLRHLQPALLLTGVSGWRLSQSGQLALK